MPTFKLGRFEYYNEGLISMISSSYANQTHQLFGNQNLSTNMCFNLENVTVDFGGIKAISSINLQIRKGEIVFVTGASGAGKTTLLNVLAGNIAPTSGNIKIDDRVFTTQVFQDLRLVEHMSLLENLQYSFDPSVYRSKKEFESDLNELVKILGIKNRIKLKAKDANGGLRQKVAIIRALLSKPDVFIADEPSSSLDFDNTKRLFDLLNIYNSKRGTTIIWASHNRELVQRFTGRIIHLDNSRLIHSGHACFI
ncbi:ATP-binding cassette domain-containing protein [Halobacteriovorax vibrionivorans]|uniref:ATP-binding cassette domain-containing protein n=2 Tax=Halobacteriovoraceae TaxID=1652132 RepID=A0ABY0IHW9_9BACT|nr:ATP-binding cassette domain-containing protein [Halobacteriovorax sp. BALOs_7]RZF22540.1 ATP-binding cassette domain-containing protein [Halobacteriovorax vibrionivorans]TGD47732.1 ATP-binding cassette domain-containing protein [Halobacteriovorax sp. Y22]